MYPLATPIQDMLLDNRVCRFSKVMVIDVNEDEKVCHILGVTQELNDCILKMVVVVIEWPPVGIFGLVAPLVIDTDTPWDAYPSFEYTVPPEETLPTFPSAIGRVHLQRTHAGANESDGHHWRREHGAHNTLEGTCKL